MTRVSVLTVLLTALVIALGTNLGVGINNAQEISHQFHLVCDEHRTLARIAKEEAEETIKSNNRLLPRINLPGISHQELVKTTEEKTENKAKHVAELELIRRETC